MTSDEIKRRAASCLYPKDESGSPTQIAFRRGVNEGRTQAAAECAGELAKARAASEELVEALEAVILGEGGDPDVCQALAKFKERER